MPLLIADCPRCGSKKITFDLTYSHCLYTLHGWKGFYEAFCICRSCKKSTVFCLKQVGMDHRGALLPDRADGKEVINSLVDIEGYIGLKDTTSVAAPEHLPPDIKAAFEEGVTCMAVQCYNAAGTMFRLCLDQATTALLPAADAQEPDKRTRRILGLRLNWLFDKSILPKELRDLSICLKEDGNDGAHAGTLQVNEAEDLLDFTIALLERMYTEPKRLELAKKRREERRSTK